MKTASTPYYADWYVPYQLFKYRHYILMTFICLLGNGAVGHPMLIKHGEDVRLKPLFQQLIHELGIHGLLF